MGTDDIRYLLFLSGRWRWRPTETMRKHGFQLVTFGRDITVADKNRALALNDAWDKTRTGIAKSDAPMVPPPVSYPTGSIGEGYLRALKLRDASREAAGKIQTKEQESRDDWPRAWKWLGPAFGDVAPKAITPEHFLCIDPKTGKLSGLVPKIETQVSISERHRAIKVWRALWVKLQAFKLVGADVADPSHAFTNTPPDPRQAMWQHHEAVRLVQGAWRLGYYGLAALIAVAWDTMLSPIDARGLTRAQLVGDAEGPFFEVDRAKTGRAAAGTLSKWGQAILTAYLAKLKSGGIEMLDNVPLFWTRGGETGKKGGRPWPSKPYSKDKAEKDFRKVREAVFGKDELRQLSDMRRSGQVEGKAGGGSREDASSKMANTIAQSARLDRTYNPVNVVSVRRFDDARVAGRKKLKSAKGARR